MTRPLLAALLLTPACVALPGCAGGDRAEPGAYATIDETDKLAMQLGMTPEEIEQKKQMLMDQGYSAMEVKKQLMAGARFFDDVVSNVAPPENIGEVVLFSSEKDRDYKLAEIIGKANLVLVFARGYTGGEICPFCTSQTAQLAAKKDDFERLDARVLVIYPGAREHLSDFEAAVDEVIKTRGEPATPWPVLLDPDLTAVNLLNILADLAYPSTFIINKQGKVVFSYVGAQRWDRPSVKALLDQLEAIESAAGPQAADAE